MTPFEVVYGTSPPCLTSYVRGTTKVDTLVKELRSQEVIMGLLKENLSKVQQQMKSFVDQHRTERTFDVGDWVFLKLQPYRQNTVSLCQSFMDLLKS